MTVTLKQRANIHNYKINEMTTTMNKKQSANQHQQKGKCKCPQPYYNHKTKCKGTSRINREKMTTTKQQSEMNINNKHSANSHNH